MVKTGHALFNEKKDCCNVSINPGRWGLFLDVRITHDGCGYVRRTWISSNVTADKGKFERKKRFVGP